MRLGLSHSLVPSSAQGADGSPVLWAGSMASDLLCHFVTHTCQQSLRCVKAVIKTCLEHCGRDQYNISVGLQGQVLGMYCPIKHSSSKGACDLSSKLIAPLRESLHSDRCAQVLRWGYLSVRVLSAVLIYDCLVPCAAEQWRWHALLPQVIQGKKKTIPHCVIAHILSSWNGSFCFVSKPFFFCRQT